MKQPRQPGPTRGGANATRGIGTHRVGLRIGIVSSSITGVQKVRGVMQNISAAEGVGGSRGAKQPPTFVNKTFVAGGRKNRIDTRTFRTFVVLCLFVIGRNS